MVELAQVDEILKLLFEQLMDVGVQNHQLEDVYGWMAVRSCGVAVQEGKNAFHTVDENLTAGTPLNFLIVDFDQHR